MPSDVHPSPVWDVTEFQFFCIAFCNQSISTVMIAFCPILSFHFISFSFLSFHFKFQMKTNHELKRNHTKENKWSSNDWIPHIWLQRSTHPMIALSLSLTVAIFFQFFNFYRLHLLFYHVWISLLMIWLHSLDVTGKQETSCCSS